jgi:hypothetical protein
MIKRRSFLGLIAAAFSPAISAKPAAFNIAEAAALDLPPAIPLNFGSMAWRPELTLVQPMVRKVVPGLVEAPAGFAVQPMFKHLTSLPIMGILSTKIDGLEFGPVTRSSQPLPEPMDWMENEMISWRDEKGNLTHPPEGYR